MFEGASSVFFLSDRISSSCKSDLHLMNVSKRLVNLKMDGSMQTEWTRATGYHVTTTHELLPRCLGGRVLHTSPMSSTPGQRC